MAIALHPGAAQFMDGNEAPYAGGTIAFFEMDGTTPKDTYQDWQLTILNPNPVPLDQAGRCILWGSGVYVAELYDAAGDLVSTETVTATCQSVIVLVAASMNYADTDGNPLDSGTVGFYIPDTLTAKSTWTDAGEGTPNDNPLTLDAQGAADIFGTGLYRQIVKDALGNLIFDRVTGLLCPGDPCAPDVEPVGIPFIDMACVEMGGVLLGLSSSPRTVTLQNIGDGDLVIDSIVVDSDYVLSGSTCTTIAASDNCTFVLTFAPTAEGSRPGTITIVSNSATSPDVFPICGTGECADFGSPLVGTAGVSIDIPLQGPLVITSITPSNANVVVSNNPGSIAADTGDVFTLTWTPTANGEVPGTVSIVTDAEDSPWTLELCGAAVQFPGALLVVDSVNSVGYSNDFSPYLTTARCACESSFAVVLTGVVGTFTAGEAIVSSGGWSGTVTAYSGGGLVFEVPVDGDHACLQMPETDAEFVGNVLTGGTSGATGTIAAAAEINHLVTVAHAHVDGGNFNVVYKNIGSVTCNVATFQKDTFSTGSNNVICCSVGPNQITPFPVVLAIAAGASYSLQHTSNSPFPYAGGAIYQGGTTLASDALNPTTKVCLQLQHGTPNLEVLPSAWDAGILCTCAGPSSMAFTFNNTGTADVYLDGLVGSSGFYFDGPAPSSYIPAGGSTSGTLFCQAGQLGPIAGPMNVRWNGPTIQVPLGYFGIGDCCP